MDADQILAFRLARSGLARRGARTLPEAAGCPASDFARNSALLALAARHDGATRDGYDRAVNRGHVVVCHAVRGAIHALAPRDVALYGSALIATDDAELAAQLGEQVQRLAAADGFSPVDALAEVAAATEEALRGGGALGKNELHDALRSIVRPGLLPWCEGCQSRHVAPMLWRYGTVKAGVRLDAGRRYVLGRPGRAPAAADAVRRFLRFYGPSSPAEFTDWAGVAKTHASRLWQAVEGELSEVPAGKRPGWILRDDEADLASPPAATGIRLLPPGDPYLQRPNRPLLAPDQQMRKRMFRSVGSPGVVLENGRVAGLWRVKAKGRTAEVAIEQIRRIGRADLEEEARRVADLRGASGLELVVS